MSDNYCDFNPKLFRSFVSMKVKVKPAMANDWEMVPYSYNTMSGFGLKSETLGYTIQDITLFRFLKFCKEQNLEIVGLKLKGNYIIGNDRSVYTEDMYKEWKDKFTDRVKGNLIPNSELIPGNEYRTVCGMTKIYLGKRYVSNIKENYPIRFESISKINLQYFTLSEYKHYDNKYRAEKFVNQRFVENLGSKFSEEKAIKYLEAYYFKSPMITCFSVNKPKPEYKLKEVSVASVIPYMTCNSQYNTLSSYVHPIITEIGSEHYIKNNGYFYNAEARLNSDAELSIDTNFYSSIDINTFNIKQVGEAWRHSYQYDFKCTPVSKFFRIDIKKETA